MTLFENVKLGLFSLYSSFAKMVLLQTYHTEKKKCKIIKLSSLTILLFLQLNNVTDINTVTKMWITIYIDEGNIIS